MITQRVRGYRWEKGDRGVIGEKLFGLCCGDKGGIASNKGEGKLVVNEEPVGAQGKSEIDGLLARVARLWQMLEGAERLLEVAHGLAVGRPPHEEAH